VQAENIVLVAQLWKGRNRLPGNPARKGGPRNLAYCIFWFLLIVHLKRDTDLNLDVIYYVILLLLNLNYIICCLLL
jgi:hypothetical protein